jgi:hypothetical protein
MNQPSGRTRESKECRSAGEGRAQRIRFRSLASGVAEDLMTVRLNPGEVIICVGMLPINPLTGVTPP